jgi:hypothetical protein
MTSALNRYLNQWEDTVPASIKTKDEGFQKFSKLMENIVSVLTKDVSKTEETENQQPSSCLPDGFIMLKDWDRCSENRYVSAMVLKRAACWVPSLRGFVYKDDLGQWIAHPKHIKDYFLTVRDPQFPKIKKRLLKMVNMCKA